MLFLTFIFVQGVSVRIFQTWDCRTYSEDASLPNPEERLHVTVLKNDYSISCDNLNGTDYNSLLGVAMLLMSIWPIGLPILYLLLIFGNIKLLKKSLIQKAVSYKDK